MRTPLITFFVFFFLALNRPGGATTPVDQGAALDTIVDIDYSFFLANPAMPWLSDPFRKNPGIAAFPHKDRVYHLQGIAFKGARSSAIIDGKSIRVGDILGDRRIAEIGPNFVVLEKGDSQIQLVLPPAGADDREMTESWPKSSAESAPLKAPMSAPMSAKEEEEESIK